MHIYTLGSIMIKREIFRMESDEFWTVKHVQGGPGGSSTSHAYHDYPNGARVCLTAYAASPYAALAWGVDSPLAQDRCTYRVALGCGTEEAARAKFPQVQKLFCHEEYEAWFAEWDDLGVEEALHFAETAFSVWPDVA